MEKNKTKDTYYMLLDKNHHKIFASEFKSRVSTFDNFDDALEVMNKIPEAKHIVKIEETIIWDEDGEDKE